LFFSSQNNSLTIQITWFSVFLKQFYNVLIMTEANLVLLLTKIFCNIFLLDQLSTVIMNSESSEAAGIW